MTIQQKGTVFLQVLFSFPSSSPKNKLLSSPEVLFASFGLLINSIAFIIYYAIDEPSTYFAIVLWVTELIPTLVMCLIVSPRRYFSFLFFLFFSFLFFSFLFFQTNNRPSFSFFSGILIMKRRVDSEVSSFSPFSTPFFFSHSTFYLFITNRQIIIKITRIITIQSAMIFLFLFSFPHSSFSFVAAYSFLLFSILKLFSKF